MRAQTIFITLLSLAAIAAVLYFMFRMQPADDPVVSTSTGGTATTTPGVSSVSLAMLDTSGTMPGKSRGCDRVVMVPVDVATTTAPLSAAMRALFALSTTSVNGLYNFIDRTNETLQFESATVDGGVARIYLSGSLTGLAGVCDDPRAAIQIEETALQFSTVSSVELFLNGTSTDLIPSEA